MRCFETDEVEEPSLRPITPPEAAPPRNPEQRASVEKLLSYLSPRAQAILRLRYGLSDDDEHAHATAEIARALGMDRKVVLSTEKDALTRLSALVSGQATLVKRGGKTCISHREASTPLTLTAEEEAVLRQASARLVEQGKRVSSRLLARETGLSLQRVLVFFRREQGASSHQTSTQERQQRLEAACKQLEAQGQPITGKGLSALAHVRKQVAYDFLRALKGGCNAAASR